MLSSSRKRFYSSAEVVMIRNPRYRRTLSLILLVLGGVLLFFAPEDVWLGAVLVGLGVVLEIVGAAMHRGSA